MGLADVVMRLGDQSITASQNDAMNKIVEQDNLARQTIAKQNADAYSRFVDIQGQQQGLATKQQAFTETQQAQQQAINGYNEFVKSLLAAAQSARMNGTAPEQIAIALKNSFDHAAQLEQLGQKLGIPGMLPGTSQRLFEQVVLQPTAVEAAKVAGAAQGTQQAAQIGTLAPVVGGGAAVQSVLRPAQRYSETGGVVTDTVTGETFVDPEAVAANIQRGLATRMSIRTSPTALESKTADLLVERQKALAEPVTRYAELLDAFQAINTVLGERGPDAIAELRMLGQKFGTTFGVDVGFLSKEDVNAYDAAKRLVSQAAVAQQAVLKGQTSDRDMQLMLSIPPNYYMLPDGRKLTMHVMTELANRVQERAEAGAEALSAMQQTGVPDVAAWDRAVKAVESAQRNRDFIAGTPYEDTIRNARSADTSAPSTRKSAEDDIKARYGIK